MKYRIKTKQSIFEDTRYSAQRKSLFRWVEIDFCYNLESAQSCIDKDIKRRAFKSEIVKEIDTKAGVK